MQSEKLATGWQVQDLDWDTAMLGVSAGIVHFAECPSAGGRDFQADLSEALHEARRRGIRFLTVKLPTINSLQINACLAQKGILVDTELTFTKTPCSERTTVPTKPDIHVDRFTQFWDESLLELAGTLRLSRYFRDPNIPAANAERLWQTSIRNSCEGRADYSIVVFVQGKPAAVTNIFERSGVSDIFLIAVLPAFQGMGLGRMMLSWYDAQLPEYIVRQTVETQVDNYPAQALYARMGYLNTAAKHTIHFWL